MNITVQSKNIVLSEKQKQYVDEKIRGLSKFFDGIINARIDVGLENKHHQNGEIYFAHVNIDVPGKTLRVEELEPTLEKAINKAKDDLGRQIKSYKSRFDKSENHSIRSMNSDSVDLQSDIEGENPVFESSVDTKS